MSGRSRGRPPKVAKTDPLADKSSKSRDSSRASLELEDVIQAEMVSSRKSGRGRGRPAKNSEKGGGGENEGESVGLDEAVVEAPSGVVSNTVMRKLAKSLPSQPNDGDQVCCGDCGIGPITLRQFRLHNIQCHLNTATTLLEKAETVMDHKYFARKLNECKKLTKLTVFACPRKGCTANFKSTLGLAYHMNTCGRTQEELDAVLLECEVCHQKFTLPNLAWHRKTHEEKGRRVDTALLDEEKQSLLTVKGNKRKSALIARKSFKRAAAGEESADGADDDDWVAGEEDQEPQQQQQKQPTSNRNTDSQQRGLKRRAERQATATDLESNDYTALALEFLEGIDQKGANCWDDPPRFGDDPFLHLNITDTVLEAPKNPVDYLPSHQQSVEFKLNTSTNNQQDENNSEYHRLRWFEGETVEVSSSTNSCEDRLFCSIHHTGGSVLSMAWHPSGNFLAVSVGYSYNQDIDSLAPNPRPASIQIYRHSINVLSLQLVLACDWGCATHIQWSSFCPDIMDSFNTGSDSCFDDIEIYARLGYLAATGEDSTIRIMSFSIQDLKVAPNFEYKPKYKIKVYRKKAELELRLEESVVDLLEVGNAVRFDWHQESKYLAAGYADGTIAVFDVKTQSDLLLDRTSNRVTVINPFWTFNGHRLGVKGIVFDPSNARYLVTCGMDRQMKVWDLDTRTERDNKRTGLCLDLCWIRGWMHQVASFENLVAYQSAMHNYVRVFQMGSVIGKPSSAEIFNVTSLDFYHGLTVQGSDDGRVNCTYYDWFWRECDYERNRRKKNLCVLSSVEVDRQSYEKWSADNFNVEVRKLRKCVVGSKLYQRLGINEEEGVYSISLEAKFGEMGIFEEAPAASEGEEDEGDEDDEESDKENEDVLEEAMMMNGLDEDEYKDLTVDDAINSVGVQQQKDGLIPIYDVKNPEGVPRIIINLGRKRAASAVPMEGLEPHHVEEYIRFHSYIRVNKVVWSPLGDVVAVGYRNGLITLLPATFDSVFPS